MGILSSVRIMKGKSNLLMMHPLSLRYKKNKNGGKRLRVTSRSPRTWQAQLVCPRWEDYPPPSRRLPPRSTQSRAGGRLARPPAAAPLGRRRAGALSNPHRRYGMRLGLVPDNTSRFIVGSGGYKSSSKATSNWRGGFFLLGSFVD